MYDVITIGSGTVDAFVDTGNKLFKGSKGHVKIPFGSKLLISEVKFDTGGSGTNTSVAFARLGLKTAWAGKIGKGTNSERVMKALKKEKVDTRFVCRSKGRTGFSVILDASGHDRTILAYKGSNDDLDIGDINLKKLKTKWIYLGSMMGKSYNTAQKIVEECSKKCVKIAFNPSSYLAKKGKKFLGRLLKNVDLLVLNREEAGYIIKSPEIGKLLKGLRDLGPNIAVITEGKKGAHAYDGDYCYSIKPNKVKVAEATGAGDAFASGFLAGLIKKSDVEKALQLGLKESESVITHHGAKNKLLTWKEAENKRNTRVIKRRI